jgi:hypothetical protein
MKVGGIFGLVLAVTITLASCSASVLMEARGGATGATGSTGGSDPTTGSGPIRDPSACAVLCKDRTSPGCFDTTTCTDYCEAESPQWDAATLGAFATCVAHGNPLCYELVEDCMIGVLYPEPVEQTVTMTAEGFSAEEGLTAHASLQVEDAFVAAAPQQVQGGGFSFSWTASMHVGMGVLVFYYVDRDSDGACTPGADVTGSVEIDRPPGFGVPSWSAEIDGPMPADYVCQYL